MFFTFIPCVVSSRSTNRALSYIHFDKGFLNMRLTASQLRNTRLHVTSARPLLHFRDSERMLSSALMHISIRSLFVARFNALSELGFSNNVYELLTLLTEALNAEWINRRVSLIICFFSPEWITFILHHCRCLTKFTYRKWSYQKY